MANRIIFEKEHHMRGLPKSIKTKEDLQNLFKLAQEGYDRFEKDELIALIKSLLRRQYHSTPILSVDGKVVTTLFFPEVKEGSVTEDGINVTGVVHVEDAEADGEGLQFSQTQITLSKAPTDTAVLSVYMEDNYLTRNGFEIAEINYILGVLQK